MYLNKNQWVVLALIIEIFLNIVFNVQAQDADLYTLSAPKSSLVINLKKEDLPAKVILKGWYCGATPINDMQQIKDAWLFLTRDNTLPIEKDIALRAEKLDFLKRKSSMYLKNKSLSPEDFWDMKTPQPWLGNPEPGKEIVKVKENCYTEKQLKTMKWEAIRWAEDIQSYLDTLHGR